MAFVGLLALFGVIATCIEVWYRYFGNCTHGEGVMLHTDGHVICRECNEDLGFAVTIDERVRRDYTHLP